MGMHHPHRVMLRGHHQVLEPRRSGLPPTRSDEFATRSVLHQVAWSPLLVVTAPSDALQLTSCHDPTHEQRPETTLMTTFLSRSRHDRGYQVPWTVVVLDVVADRDDVKIPCIAPVPARSLGDAGRHIP